MPIVRMEVTNDPPVSTIGFVPNVAVIETSGLLIRSVRLIEPPKFSILVALIVVWSKVPAGIVRLKGFELSMKPGPVTVTLTTVELETAPGLVVPVIWIS